MLLKVFCIYDIKAETYLNPMYFRRTEEAVRSFSEAANDPSSNFHKYAEDYALCEIGTYDDDTGLHSPFVIPKVINNALQASIQHREFYASFKLPELKAVESA